MRNKYLLDTSIFVWWMEDSSRLKEPIQNLIADTDVDVYLSVASIWEIAIKKKIGKLMPPKDWKETLKMCGFTIIPIELEHVYSLDKMPLHHKDPFDRMLIAQAKTEKLRLISADPIIWKYKVKVLKA